MPSFSHDAIAKSIYVASEASRVAPTSIFTSQHHYLPRLCTTNNHIIATMSNEAERTKPSLPAFDANNCQTYPASCHCGNVQYSVVLSPPLPEWKVVSCNCSICSRNGYLLVYPERSQLHMTSGEEQLRSYSFGIKRNLHKFCGRCGSAVFFDPRMQEFGEAPPDLMGVNVSTEPLKTIGKHSS